MDALRFITLFGSGVAAGVLTAILVGVVPLLRELPSAQALSVKERVEPLIDRVNPPLVIITALSALALLIFDDDASGTTNLFTAIGLAGAAVLTGISLAYQTRVGKEMQAEAGEEARFRAALGRWAAGHAARTGAGLVAAAAFALAVVAA